MLQRLLGEIPISIGRNFNLYSWNKETLQAELEEFDKNLTSILVRERLKKQGLTSRIAKSAFVEYLSPEENDFVKWASFK